MRAGGFDTIIGWFDNAGFGDAVAHKVALDHFARKCERNVNGAVDTLGNAIALNA